MNDLYDWARSNLSPDGQNKFFAEQKNIAEDFERIEAWFHRTEEAMKLTPDQLDFLHKNEIIISTAYIGMVRFYRGNRTIFQTSAMDSIVQAIFDSRDIINFDGLTKQVHEYLNLLMSAPSEAQVQLLNRNVPLFSSGELEQVRAICEMKGRYV